MPQLKPSCEHIKKLNPKSTSIKLTINAKKKDPLEAAKDKVRLNKILLTSGFQKMTHLNSPKLHKIIKKLMESFGQETGGMLLKRKIIVQEIPKDFFILINPRRKHR